MPEIACLAISWIGSGPPRHHHLCWVAFQVRCLHPLLPRYHTSLWRAPRSFLCHPLISREGQNEPNFLPTPNFSAPATEPSASSETPAQTYTRLLVPVLSIRTLHLWAPWCSVSISNQIQEQAEGCTWVAVKQWKELIKATEHHR